MHDPFKARPVSGEIMTDAAAPGRPFVAGRGTSGGIVEAEFETVRPDAPPSRFRHTPANVPEGATLLRSSGRRDRLQGRRGGLAFWTTGAILAAMAFLASGGYVLTGENRPGLAAGYEQGGGIHTAGIPAPGTDVTAHEGGEASHFLGTSTDDAETQGSFVFSDALEGPKDEEKSVSVSYYGEEE